MANPDLTPKELHFLQRMINKVKALDMSDPTAAEELRSIKYVADALESLSIERGAWEILLENEPEGPLH